MTHIRLNQGCLVFFFLLSYSVIYAQFINKITVDAGPADVGQNATLKIVNGHPAIAYDDTTNATIYYVRAADINGRVWDTPVQINPIINTRDASMTIVNGKPAMSYYNMTDNNLRYAPSFDVNGNSWGIFIGVDVSGDVGTYSSLAVVNGNPAISYYDATNGDLKYVRANDADGFNWNTPVTIDQTGNVGEHTSLLVVNGNPAISYYDVTNGDLKYVRASNPNGSAWNTPITIDQIGDVGTFNSLKIINGKPAISYYDATYGQLKYVSADDVDGNTWNTPQVIDTDGDVGQYTSLAIVNSKPAISYSDISTGDLKFIQADDASGSSWNISSLMVATSGQHTALTVINNEPAIAFYDSDNQVLKYTRGEPTTHPNLLNTFLNVYGDNHRNGFSQIEYLANETAFFATGTRSNISNTIYEGTFSKLDINGQLLWTKTYGDEVTLTSFVEQDDGNFFLMGRKGLSNNNFSIYIAKVDKNGTLIYDRTFARTGRIMAQEMVKSKNDPLGETYFIRHWISDGGAADDIAVLKIDANANILWSNDYMTGQDDQANKIIPIENGGALLLGSSSTIGWHSFLVEIDAFGSIVQSKKYFEDSNELFEISKGTTTKDGGFVLTGIAGQAGNTNRDAFMLKIDANLSYEWANKYTRPYENIYSGVVQDTEGNIHVSSFDEIDNANRMRITKYDENGGLITSVYLEESLSNPTSATTLTHTNTYPDRLIIRDNRILAQGFGENDAVFGILDTDLNVCEAEEGDVSINAITISESPIAVTSLSSNYTVNTENITSSVIYEQIETCMAEDDLGGEYYEKQMIVDISGMSEQERIDLREELGATLIETCLCGTIELWRVPDTIIVDNVPITEMHEKEEVIRMKAKVEEAGRNYLMSTTTVPVEAFDNTTLFGNHALDLRRLARIGLVDSGMDYNMLIDYLDERPVSPNDCLNDPYGYDFPNDNSIPLDFFGHGTAMAARIINAYRGALVDDRNEFDPAIADYLKITNAKAFSQKKSSLFHLLCALKYLCSKDVDIVNCSAGYSGEKSLILEKTMREFKDKCILVVTSAGNDTSNVDIIPHYPSGFDFDNIISVAATDGFHHGLSTYSNYGHIGTDVGFPGTIGALQPGGAISYQRGSSQAAAGVTSVAAMLMAQFPAASYHDIINAIFSTVTPISGLPVSTGGIVNFTNAQNALADYQSWDFILCVCLPAVACMDTTINLDAGQSFEIVARVFDNGSYSNCAEGDVFFSFSENNINDSTRVFDCSDIGAQEIQIWITDSIGQQDFCTATLTIEDNTGDCPPVPPCPPTLNLSGVFSSGLYQAAQTITSNATFQNNANVIYIAGESITLTSGFQTPTEGEFLAMIGACQSRISDEVEDRMTEEVIDISTINLNVFPNPFQNRAIIQYELFEDTRLDLYLTDFSGRVVKTLVSKENKEAGQHKISLEAARLMSGMYFLVLKTSNEIQTHKLMILENN